MTFVAAVVVVRWEGRILEAESHSTHVGSWVLSVGSWEVVLISLSLQDREIDNVPETDDLHPSRAVTGYSLSVTRSASPFHEQLNR